MGTQVRTVAGVWVGGGVLLDRTMGYPGGTPLAVMQEDFLVILVLSGT